MVFISRLIGLIKKHKTSIYLKCWECGMMGINIPEYHECGNCGSHNTTEYYPVRHFDLTTSGRKEGRK